MSRPEHDHPAAQKTGTDTVPDHGIPPGSAEHEAKGTPNNDRHRTEHAVVSDEARDPPHDP